MNWKWVKNIRIGSGKIIKEGLGCVNDHGEFIAFIYIKEFKCIYPTY